MKKLFLFISIFFLTNLTNSISAPIKVFGLDVTMDLKTAEDVLKNQNYQCNNINGEMIMCDNSGKSITVSKDLIQINCEAYGGCKYNSVEVANFFSKELNLRIENPEIIGIFQEPAYCGEGPDGDKICVIYSLTSDLGPSIDIMKHKLGGSGMSLN